MDVSRELEQQAERSHARRTAMVDRQLRARGISDARVLQAFASVPREWFVRPDLAEFAYNDASLPIDNDQTISQPYIVACMLEQLRLEGYERVLEVGAGSGYAAALLGELAREVVGIERHPTLARAARERIERLGLANVALLAGDGTLGVPQRAPFDAILVSAGGALVPEALKRQLKIGGRMIIPIGGLDAQRLVRLTRTGAESFAEVPLSRVMFVPLVGGEQRGKVLVERAPERREPPAIEELIAGHAERFDDIEHVDLRPWLERTGSARVVALGDATHGTSEFYRMRARLSQALIEHADFNVIALEADWPDVAVLDRYIGNVDGRLEIEPFARFPQWMWRNEEVTAFVEWLRDFNARRSQARRVRLVGLDLYSMGASAHAVIETLRGIDPGLAEMARTRYACLTPWQSDPTSYGAAVINGRYEACAPQVVSVLRNLLDRGLTHAETDELLGDAIANARVVANAEKYYRAMFFGGAQSWNLRDQHMFDTLTALLTPPANKAIVWAHNSHLGDARATDFANRGEHNLGQLIRQAHGDRAYLVGFGTHEGTVLAAHDWGGEPEIMDLQPSLDGSIERACQQSGVERFLLPLRSRHGRSNALTDALAQPYLERAIGVIYRPGSERLSHYFHARVAEQFDEYIWFRRSEALHANVPSVRLLA